ncbi:DUF1513 domain-containing protein [Flavimaricola marinus]|uniref:Twin-arginine translocation pathway signal n=1 Tax=Flavimaricola marinus TaxID=1819565 RepID=A0A238L9F9_9RHOB|nr:DUF1513 domain-containing protein [Flavimaricola marinus]SMY06337.1 hypothetical protein LOM8899_00460 [Flavimaricola marinus]
MATSRRQFIAGLLATGLAPKPTWADAGSPSFLSAGALRDGTFVLCGIDAALNPTFRLRLPARGHAAAAHPSRPEAVAFARRPGAFAVVIDCVSGEQAAMLTAPAGRHFYGHGAFSSDGQLLYTTENDYEAGRGRIGVWDATAGYVRIDEWDGGGIGPHDIKRLPGSESLVVANGGIETHPESGRTKLNIATMTPNLAYLRDGAIIETVELPRDMHKNSIRHLAICSDQRVAFGMQWQGDGRAPSLVGHHRLGEQVTLMPPDSDAGRDMQGYVGSIAVSADGRTIAATSPRGNVVQTYDVEAAEQIGSLTIEDVCGVVQVPGGFAVTSGTGELRYLGDTLPTGPGRRNDLAWDNHLIQI